MDLARKIDLGSNEQKAAPEPRVIYPSLSLNDDVAEQFLKEFDCKIGDEYTAEVRFKVTGQRQDEFGKSVSFDVLSMDDIAEEHQGDVDEDGDEGEGGSGDEDEGEKSMLGYNRPKSQSVKESPDLSAKDLED